MQTENTANDPIKENSKNALSPFLLFEGVHDLATLAHK
jgi:hypothetical protein